MWIFSSLGTKLPDPSVLPVSDSLRHLIPSSGVNRLVRMYGFSSEFLLT